MAKINVGIFQQITKGRELELSGTTVREILNELCNQYPELRQQLFNDEGKLRSFINIYVNDDDIRYLEREDTPIGPGDSLSIVPSIAGGDPAQASSHLKGGFHTQMPEPFDEATLTVTLKSSQHTVADVAFLVNSIDNLTMASLWGSLKDVSPQDATLNWARHTLQETMITSRKRERRFFPGLLEYISGRSQFEGNRRRFGEDFELEFDPFDPLDVGVQSGLNAMLRRLLRENDSEQYGRLFSFAVIRRLDHHSPLVLELAAVLAGAVAMPALLLYGCMAAVYYGRRREAEVSIREAERGLKEEELKQSKIRTHIQEQMAASIADRFSNQPREIPDVVLAETARIASTTVADLGSSPLIGSISIGLSAKGK